MQNGLYKLGDQGGDCSLDPGGNNSGWGDMGGQGQGEKERETSRLIRNKTGGICRMRAGRAGRERNQRSQHST